MAKKGGTGVDLELAAMAAKLEKTMESAAERVREMKQYENSGSAKPEELDAIREAGELIRKRREDPDGPLARVRRGALTSKQEIRRAQAVLEKHQAETEALLKSLDGSEIKFKKYNLPKRYDDFDGEDGDHEEPLEAYLERVSEFIRVTWWESARESRGKGLKCLAEWIGELGTSPDEKRRATWKAMRAVLVELGTRISRFLVDYFLIVAVTLEKDELVERVEEVESVIQRLRIEEEEDDSKSSAVIDTFVAVVRFFKRTVKAAAKKLEDPAKRRDAASMRKRVRGREKQVLHMVLVEIVRLEVSFRSPDLPMMLLNDVFIMMGQHLIDNVFEDKLNRIGALVCGLKMEVVMSRGSNSAMSIFEQVLDLGVKQAWNEIDMTAKNKTN